MSNTDFPEYYEAKSPPEWATYCPDRSPEFKVHTKLGLAHSAIADKKPSREVALYHLEVNPDFTQRQDGPNQISIGVGTGKAVWKKVWEYTFPTHCPECGGSFQVNRWGRLRSNYNIPSNYKGIIKDAPVICDNCYYAQRQAIIDENKRQWELKELERLQAKHGNS